MKLASLRDRISTYYLADQASCLKQLLARLNPYSAEEITAQAHAWVTETRKQKNRSRLSAAFLREYQLSSFEGIVLMSIAEALLRIPDSHTQDQLLQEKLTVADWQKHLRHSDSLWVNLSTGVLLITGKLEHLTLQQQHDWQPAYQTLMNRLGAPIIRAALVQAMHYLARQFVISEDIETALTISRQQNRYRYSFDMLGEAAITAADAEQYFQSYAHAIAQLGQQTSGQNIFANPGISIKLSALYPRYEPLQEKHAIVAIRKRLLELAQQAKHANINLTLDAEECARLEMSLEIFAAVYCHPELDNWSGLGMAVQAYQKRAMSVIDWLAELSLTHQKKIPVRLVKGAYWDTEIKLAQQQGLSDYPVFTTKTATDVSYLACANQLLTGQKHFYPQFATHNAHTIAALLKLAEQQQHSNFELQRLHGMGEPLYQSILSNRKLACRIYAPVGHYRELLPYLVRRLLENGANNSFINQMDNPALDIDLVVSDPVFKLTHNTAAIPDPIVLPIKLYAPERTNSEGLNLNDRQVLKNIKLNLDKLALKQCSAYPIINGIKQTGKQHTIFNPAQTHVCVGTVQNAAPLSIKLAIDAASEAVHDWRLCDVEKRAQYLTQAADLLEKQRMELASLCIREAGRTITDALSEIREAVDFCRYYAHSAISLFENVQSLPGPFGEQNHLRSFGRGVFACISPWNFPIAIFIGQISAALAAGNTVIAKPASSTPLAAMRCIQLLHQAGIPENVLHFLPAESHQISQHLLTDPRIAGVAFTGSSHSATSINLQLADHQQIKTLIAETGGQNIMIADSSALPEQLVHDVLTSAFNSAGQRCSALRVLFIQNDIADKVIKLLAGAMLELRLGDPAEWDTDIGPVINQDALDDLNTHLIGIQNQAKLLYQTPTHSKLNSGYFFAPALVEIQSLAQLQQEVFGPLLHLIRFKAGDLNNIIDAVNHSGYGLTFGIHSRIEANIHTIQEQVRVGNIYVNRNMIGAVVGSQPFGGMGQSGTGPKAGGPTYLQRFAVEQTITTNTAAIGGNASLMAKDLG